MATVAMTVNVDDAALAAAVAAENAQVAADNLEAKARFVRAGGTEADAPAGAPPFTAQTFLQGQLDALAARWRTKAEAQEAARLRATFETKSLAERRQLLGMVSGR